MFDSGLGWSQLVSLCWGWGGGGQVPFLHYCCNVKNTGHQYQERALEFAVGRDESGQLGFR